MHAKHTCRCTPLHATYRYKGPTVQWKYWLKPCAKQRLQAQEHGFSVGRTCSSSNPTSCSDICTYHGLKNQDVQTRGGYMVCTTAYHVYLNRPSTNPNGNKGTATLGLKSIRVSCYDGGCRPNFCCCVS